MHLRRIAVAYLACWAIGPAMGFGVALHQLEHHLPEREPLASSGMTQVLLHGHDHEDDASDHSHGAVPRSVIPSRLLGESYLAVADAATGVGVFSPLAALVWQSRLPPDPSSLGPPSPFSLCVLRL